MPLLPPSYTEVIKRIRDELDGLQRENTEYTDMIHAKDRDLTRVRSHQAAFAKHAASREGEAESEWQRLGMEGRGKDVAAVIRQRRCQ